MPETEIAARISLHGEIDAPVATGPDGRITRQQLEEPRGAREP